MKTLTFDLSTVQTGVCLFDVNADKFLVLDKFLIEVKGTPKERLVKMSEAAISYVSLYGSEIEQVVIEGVFVTPKMMHAAKPLYELRGAFKYLLFTKTDLTIMEYAPMSIKKMMTGKGNAGKPLVIEKVGEVTGLLNLNNNVADAIAIAYTHYHTIRG